MSLQSPLVNRRFEPLRRTRLHSLKSRSPFHHTNPNPEMNLKMEDDTETSKINRRVERVVVHLTQLCDKMEVKDMSTSELSSVVVGTAKVADLSAGLHARVTTELWTRPEYLEQKMHCESPYDPNEARERLRFLQPVDGSSGDRGGSNWTGYWFAIKDDKEEYVLRIFDKDKPEFRDVVKLEDAQKKPFLLSRSSRSQTGLHGHTSRYTRIHADAAGWSRKRAKDQKHCSLHFF